jgi:hypothetical protein
MTDTSEYCSAQNQWCTFMRNGSCLWNKEGDKECCFEVGE